MYFYFTPISALLLINSFILVFLGTILITDRQKKEAVTYALLMFAIAIWAFFGAAENAAITIPAKIFFAMGSYIGILAVGPLWLIFTLQYIRSRKSLISLTKVVALLLYFGMLILTLTNPFHNLLWTSYNQIGSDIVSGVIFGHGVVWYINVVIQYLMIFIGLILIFRAASKSHGIERRSLLLIALATLIPWLGNFVFIYFSPAVTRGADLAPITFCLTGLIVVFSIYRYRLFSTVSLAVNNIYHSIGIGIVVFDKDRRVLDYNRAAKKIVGDPLERGISVGLLDELSKMSFAMVLATRGKSVQVNIKDKWLILATEKVKSISDETIGYTVTITDITEEMISREKLKSQLEKVSKINELMVGRELKMVELKKKVNEIKDKK